MFLERQSCVPIDGQGVPVGKLFLTSIVLCSSLQSLHVGPATIKNNSNCSATHDIEFSENDFDSDGIAGGCSCNKGGLPATGY